ncbi:MAG TPA: PAS domain S-box protein [Patescibacteria group bacterium]|nr:PAS domain S-box protein [Patescibacteria group bacterium]
MDTIAPVTEPPITRLSQPTAYLAAIVDSSDDAIISKNLNGIITSWNRAAQRIFGYTADEAVGQSILMIIPPERQAEEADIIARLKAGQRVDHFETVRVAKDGRRVNLSVTISPIRDDRGVIIGASKVARDITAQKEAEERLLAYTRELERSNQELDDFAYIASHDLKEPLRGLHNHATFLIEDYQGVMDEDGVRRLKRLSELTQRMEVLINDLLYFSRLGRADLAFQETDLNTVVADIGHLMEGYLRERNARIEVPKPLPVITCDRTRITEAFRNLITNAAKYNDKAERVIEIGFLEHAQRPEGPEQNVFYVRDNGVGIDPKFHKDIFRIFRRLKQPAGEEAGTGVGLTFVKKIVERHGGRIWVDSVPGDGTTFYFTLPERSIPDAA